MLRYGCTDDNSSDFAERELGEVAIRKVIWRGRRKNTQIGEVAIRKVIWRGRRKNTQINSPNSIMSSHCCEVAEANVATFCIVVEPNVATNIQSC